MINPHNVFWSEISLDIGNLYLASTDKGICYMTLPNESFETLQNWMKKQIPNSKLVHDSETFMPFISEIKDYLNGIRKEFTVPLDLYGTSFQLSVWNYLHSISYGKTQNYTEVSAGIQKPNAVRAVGAAIGANPIPIVIPCHRVIGKNGSLTGYRGGLELKSKLLQLETTCFA